MGIRAVDRVMLVFVHHRRQAEKIYDDILTIFFCKERDGWVRKYITYFFAQVLFSRIL